MTLGPAERKNLLDGTARSYEEVADPEGSKATNIGARIRARTRITPKISVVTVTKRPGSIDITWGALQQQTLDDFEWILCDELFHWRRKEVEQYVNDPRLRHIPAPVRKGDLWNLNKSYNEALRYCRGQFVVSLQDYIWIPPEGLANYWRAYQDLGPRVFLTGISHAHALPAPVHDLRGPVTIFSAPYSKKPMFRTRIDVRFRDSDSPIEERDPADWELNWAGAPLCAFYEIGGFSEKHDGEFYSCDNLTIAYCAQQLGYRIYLDQANECYPVDHGEIFPKSVDWEERHGRFGPWEQWYTDWLRKGCPRFPYLTDAPTEPLPLPCIQDHLLVARRSLAANGHSGLDEAVLGMRSTPAS
jgi:hypothetical protein